MLNQALSLNKNAIAKSFSKAANSYNNSARLQIEIGQRLIERLDFIKIAPGTIVDLGSGTGTFATQLQCRYPDADVIQIDLATGMLFEAKKNNPQALVSCADAEQLPFDNLSVDFIFSNCTIQWLNNPLKLFKELHRILKPGGLLLFTTFGPDTLIELATSWAQVDNYIHTHQFVDMHHIGDALLKNKFHDPVVDTELITLNYSSVSTLIQDLKKTGAHNLVEERHRGLTTKSKWQKMLNAYQKFKTKENLFPASYEVIYGHSWGAACEKRQFTLENGSTAIPIEAITTL